MSCQPRIIIIFVAVYQPVLPVAKWNIICKHTLWILKYFFPQIPKTCNVSSRLIFRPNLLTERDFSSKLIYQPLSLMLLKETKANLSLLFRFISQTYFPICVDKCRADFVTIFRRSATPNTKYELVFFRNNPPNTLCSKHICTAGRVDVPRAFSLP